MKLSIITANYNKEKYLDALFDSIIDAVAEAGAYAKVEHVIIDDKSTDNSVKKINNYKKRAKHKVVLSINKSNLGLGDSRNAGTDLAVGNYMWHTDSDDIIDKHSVVKILENIKSQKILYKYDWKRFPDKTPKSRWHLYNAKNLKHFYSVGYHVATSIWLRKWFNQAGGRFLKQNGDVGCWIALEKLNPIKDVEFSREIVYWYRTVGDSMSQNSDHYQALVTRLLNNLLIVQKNLTNQKVKKIFESQTYHIGVEYIFFIKKNSVDAKENMKKIKCLNGRFRFYMLLRLIPSFIVKLFSTH